VPQHVGGHGDGVARTTIVLSGELFGDDWVVSGNDDNPEALQSVEQRGTDGGLARDKTFDVELIVAGVDETARGSVGVLTNTPPAGALPVRSLSHPPISCIHKALVLTLLHPPSVIFAGGAVLRYSHVCGGGSACISRKCTSTSSGIDSASSGEPCRVAKVGADGFHSRERARLAHLRHDDQNGLLDRRLYRRLHGGESGTLARRLCGGLSS